MTVEEIFAGAPDAVDALARADVATWQILLEHLVEHAPATAPAGFVAALLSRDADPETWFSRSRAAAEHMRSAWFATIRSATRNFDPWLMSGLRGALPADDPAMLAARYRELRDNVSDEDDVLRVRQLIARIERVCGRGALLADAWLLLNRRAGEADDGDLAVEAASTAEQLYASLGDDENARVATRMRGVALLRAGRLDEAFEVLEEVMRSRGPLFGGRGAQRSARYADPRKAALDEAAAFATWATHRTPDWVRALGGLAERLGDAALERRFHRALEAMLKESRWPVSDLEVVVRHAVERDQTSTARAAAELLAARHPDDLVAANIAGSFFWREREHERAWRIYARAAEANPTHEHAANAWIFAAEGANAAGASDDARRLLEEARAAASDGDEALELRIELLATMLQHAGDPAKAADQLWSLFERARADTDLISETRTGVDLVDRTLDALLRVRDRRALDVAEELYRAKRDRWGECPPVWLERHNLGSVHAQLGDVARARELVADALARLQEFHGDAHEHVQMARRTLTRIDAGG